VTVTITGQKVTVKGLKGEVFYTIPDDISVNVSNGIVTILQEKGKEEDTKALFGLTRATIANLINGVTVGFEKKLELSGVGYRAQMSGNDLMLSVGFSHPVKVSAPNGIKFSITDNVINIMGIDKTLVGNTAAKIRGIRPPEPYKGKGIKYINEYIRRKAGKAAKAVGGATK
jgi:large subunit ribosomal protein L6